jgi:hypothetical protein
MTTRYSVDDANVAWRVTDGEAIVLHADSSAYFGLNLSGTMLWAQLAEHPMTADELASWAQRHFTGTPATLLQEIHTFIEQLQTGNLLETADETGAPSASLDAVDATAPGTQPWEAPVAECFGELEKLILSGE